MKFQLPSRLSEANIQAEFYRQCKDAGINIYLEYKYQNCIFDAVIYNNDEIEHIIEFKSYKTTKKPKINTKQLKKYSSFGIHIILITRMESISFVVDFLSS